MPQATIPVRFIYRSQSMIPLLTIIHGADLWRDEGIDVRDVRRGEDPLDAEEQLFAGQVDFVFGNHISPYMRLSKGHPLVCLAQTENANEIWVATRPDLTDLGALRGKRVVVRPLFAKDGGFSGHAEATRLLLLELRGIDTRELHYVEPDGSTRDAERVRDGEADACFVTPERDEAARRAGLVVHELPPLPMVHSITFTTTVPRLQRRDDLAERVIRVLLCATHFLKTRKEETLELWKKPIAAFRPGQYERLVAHYDRIADEYEASLYPRAEAIINVHKLACMVYPEARGVNPLELWNLHYLRQVHLSGYTARLYGGSPATP